MKRSFPAALVFLVLSLGLAQDLRYKELDCHCKWRLSVIGGCPEDKKGLCGITLLITQIEKVPGVEKAQYDKKTKSIIVTVKLGRKVNVKYLQDKIGPRWIIKNVEET